jgi:tetratricopeptide (TPR) repeat protein
VRKASALALGGKVAESDRVSAEARQVFEQLEKENGPSDEMTTAIGLAIMSKMSTNNFFRETADLRKAESLLLPLVESGRAGRTAKLALANLYAMLAHTQERETGLKTCETARKILTDIGAKDLTDLTAASVYGDVTDTQARIALRLGRLEDSKQLSTIVGEMAEKVLEHRPGDLQAMINRYYSAEMRGQVAATRNQYGEAEVLYKQAAESARNYVLFNPADNLGWGAWNGSNVAAGNVLLQQGRLAGALEQYRTVTAREKDPRNKTGSDLGVLEAWAIIGQLEAQQGNLRTARAAVGEVRRVGDLILKERNASPELVQLIKAGRAEQEFDLLAVEGDYATIHAHAAETLVQIAQIKETSADNRQFRVNISRENRAWLIESALRLGRAEEALTVIQQAFANPLTDFVNATSATRQTIRNKVALGRALTAAGRLAEAQAPFDEAIAFYRAELTEGANGVTFTQNFTRALYYKALAQAGDAAGRARRLALLEEAMQQLGGLSVEAQQLHDNQELLKWVSAARREARAGE